jgi:hypothetical protein
MPETTETTTTAQTGQQQQTSGGQQQQPPTFDAWLATVDDGVKGLIDGHVKGLRTALESERGGRKDLEKQVRDLAKVAEKDSDAQKRLTEIADKLSETDRRAAFYEAAHAVGVTNLKLAYTVAVQDEMFDRHGNPNMERLKQAYPELFAGARATVQPAGNAGRGTNQITPATGMNVFIRRAAGR